MEGRSRHCPHLGLKHTRSIRFSSPTPEHRCYIFGEPLEIQVDQRTYCLGERYSSCPRFAGQEAPPAPAAARPARAAGRQGGLAAFWQRLGTRDRILYLSLVGLLVAILATYGIIIGVVLPARGHPPTPVPTTPASPTTTVAIAPTVEPTAAPTARPTTAPTTVAATAKPPATSPVLPTATPPPTAPPTATPRPTVPPTVAPTPVPPPESMWSRLYFLGPDKAYHVPVERESRPYTEGMARRALEQMILGPRGSLLRSMPAGMGVNWGPLRVEGGTLYLDLTQTFELLGAGRQEALAVVLAMTEFSTVSRVQFSVNGAPYGLPGSGNTDPVERPAYINFEDPYGIGEGAASNLILYFATPDGAYLFPVVRRVAHTVGVARATIDEMIKGPGSGYQALTLLPAGTAIQSIARVGDTIVVDFNSAFLNASNRDLTVKALVLAMTDLTADGDLGVTSVRISVNGADLGSYWGSAYSGDLYRPRVNPESP